MEENRARRVSDALRAKGVEATLRKAGVYQFGVSVHLPDGREAVWDTDGTAGLEAQVMRNGMLVGFVPHLPGSEDFDEDEVVEAIWHTDYDTPIARRASTPPMAGEPLRPRGGLFQRAFDGFRYR
jgi:hypothetical protein